VTIDDAFSQAFRTHQRSGDLFHATRGEDHGVFQSSTIGALMEGVYDGEMTCGELAEHGDFGLGTFDALDGEMVALDGRFFRARSDGRAYPVSPSATTPFAVMTRFEPTVQVTWAAPTDWRALREAMDRALPSKNLFYAIKVRAHFHHIKVRTVPCQRRPYPPLVQIARGQPEFSHENIEGTLVGFRFPEYTQGINVAGYHMHFLDATETVGGHVLELRMRDAIVDLDVTARLHLEVPQCGAFLAADLAQDERAAIHEAEH
jgi:acetolactate decarboxylase